MGSFDRLRVSGNKIKDQKSKIKKLEFETLNLFRI
jgi:hypothetical protein